MNLLRLSLVLALLSFGPLAHGASESGLQTMDLTVDGVSRTALVYAPPVGTSTSLPVVFVFHGHGGTSRNAVNTFGITHLWPEAISVYPQGLDTPGQLTDPDGLRSGWQKAMGDQGDRDLHFFDAILTRLKKDYPVDPKRIYCTGHSNGGGFTYLLWLARADVFAAMAPCSGAARYVMQLTPKPAMILGGQRDPLVKFEWQERMMESVRGINGCDATGVPWQTVGTVYPSKSGTPVVTFIYPGGHAMDPAEPGLIVKFFQSILAQRLLRSVGQIAPRRFSDGSDASFQLVMREFSAISVEAEISLSGYKK